MPSWSTTSKAAVFCPSSRNGFTEFTSVTGCRSAIRRTIVSAWSKLPSTVRTFAPWIAACESLPRATEPFGTITKARIPARAANAAAEAEVLPVEAQITARERSEEHTSELQSHHDLVCRLLREKKRTTGELASTAPGFDYWKE